MKIIFTDKERNYKEQYNNQEWREGDFQILEVREQFYAILLGWASPLEERRCP